MSKLSIVTLIACAVSIPSAMAIGNIGYHPNNNGTVNFSGHVYSNSCTISNGDDKKQVNLSPVLNTRVDDKVGAQFQQFNIQVKNCYVHEKLVPKLVWGKTNSLPGSGYLENKDKNGAKNVALVIRDRNDRHINLNNGYGFEPEKNNILHNNPTLTYKFSVGYIKKFSFHDVTSGPVTSQANYSITYL
ncbi:MAG: fimbrial protein [Citrobacter sp.]|uniref:fimbrial protein n=1 Tax=Citrobacter sp. TaxID=1896336 RepID=UPI002FC73D03